MLHQGVEENWYLPGDEHASAAGYVRPPEPRPPFTRVPLVLGRSGRSDRIEARRLERAAGGLSAWGRVFVQTTWAAMLDDGRAAPLTLAAPPPQGVAVWLLAASLGAPLLAEARHQLATRGALVLWRVGEAGEVVAVVAESRAPRLREHLSGFARDLAWFAAGRGDRTAFADLALGAMTLAEVPHAEAMALAVAGALAAGRPETTEAALRAFANASGAEAHAAALARADDLCRLVVL